MGRDHIAAVGREQKAKSVIDFCLELQSTLHNPSSPELVLADISHYITSITAIVQKTSANLSTEVLRSVERHGRDLWNICIRLNRDEPKRDERLLPRARLYAFLMLELGRFSRRKQGNDASEAAYLLDLAMSLGRSCLKSHDLDSARAALQKAAEYVDRLRQTSENITKIEADYFTMRIALSWKEGRLDVAEHMFTKVEELEQRLDVSTVESLTDTLQHIGADMLAKSDLVMAEKWLRRAHHLIHAQPLDHLSIEGLDIRFATCNDLVKALLTVGSVEAMAEADSIVSYIEAEVGDRPVVLYWRLELLRKRTDSFDAEPCASVLRRIIKAFDFTEPSLIFLLQQIVDLKDSSGSLACGLLDELLLSKIIRSGNTDWLGKVMIRRVWLSTVEKDCVGSQAVQSLISLLSSVSESMSGHLDPDAIGAIHSLIWKRAESTYTKQQFELTDQWCEAALNSVFHHSGEVNQVKFWRKRILSAIALNNTERVRALFAMMPEGGQTEPLTQYLMFKASLLDWDAELGRRSIQQLAKSIDHGKSQEMLYACMREAQQAGDKLCTLAALKAVAENWEAGSSPRSSLPAIIRCSIRLIFMMESSSDAKPDEFIDDACKLFEIAASRAKRGQKTDDGKKMFTVLELHWFSKNSYNMAVNRCERAEVDPSTVVRLLNCCLDFISCYPEDVPREDSEHLALLAARCHFVNAAASISYARTTDGVDEQLQRYLETRQHAAAFHALLEGVLSDAVDEVKQDLIQKSATLIMFDFEGAVALKSWDDLSGIVRKAEHCGDELSLKAMGDCLLRSHASGKVMYANMRLIINMIHALENFDCEKLAKYIRCVFQAILPLDCGLALELADQAHQIAQQSREVGRPLPSNELEWMAATSFNHSIDFYARGEEKLCSCWALKAMELAMYVDDEGQLCQLLRDRYARLQFQQDGQ